LTIEAWYIPVDSARGTVILFHGLGGNKSFMLDQAYEFMYLGFNVMLMELRAHGNSGSCTTTLGVRESEEVKLAYDFISGKGERNIILYGFSLGAVVITKGLYDYDISPSGIILDTPFGNLKSLFEGRARVLGFPEEPFGVLVTFWSGAERGFNGFRHNTCEYVKKIKCRVLLQYGALDKLVTQRETNCIYKNISSLDKRLVVYKDVAHEPFLNKDPDKWRTEIRDFLLK
jgi:alpha-beta hydrolase superfamily lysophospholipase